MEFSEQEFQSIEPNAAYIHVPFCVHRCGYCDFTVIAGRDDLADDYLNALATELATLQTPRPVDTIFIGGGTPTQLTATQLQRLLKLLGEWFVVADNGEFSVEANPDGLADDKISILADGGVNRISLGMQSFDAEMLKVLERTHSPGTIEHAINSILRRIDNYSLDLIFGVPGQTIEVWESTLASAIAFKPKHISTYGLTFEKGTTFWSRRKHGSMVQIDDSIEREMYATGMQQLTGCGYEHYEISNFAQPGFACRHNQTYWNALPYFGFGPGAARYIAGQRETNHRSALTWLKRITRGESPVADAETLSPEDRAREAIMLGLRQATGVNRESFTQRTGFVLDELLSPEFRVHIDSGYVEDDGHSIRLTQSGKFVADTIMVDAL